MRKMIARASVCAAMAAGVGTSHAQNVDRQFDQPAVQFNLSPPGARSLAMGASFIGLADDATAAESNPAGLTILTKPEVSGHLRFSRFENEFPDTVAGRGFGTFEESVTSPSFFSIVYPKGRVAVSAYYQRAADFRSSSRFEGTFPVTVPGVGTIEVFDVDTTESAFRVENLGLSLAYKVASKLSIGATIRSTRLAIDSSTRVALTYPRFPGFSDSFEIGADASDRKITYNVGVLLSPSSKLSIGAVLKKGAAFGELPATASSRSVFPGGVEQESFQENVRLSLPDVYGAGIAFRPTDRWTLLTDVVRVTYSDLGASNSIFAEFGEGGAEDIKDATELHVGTEYTFTAGQNNVVAVRAGAYTDPDHDGLGGVDSDQVHATFGFGVVLNNRIQIDAALNLAKRVREVLTSFVLRF